MGKYVCSDIGGLSNVLDEEQIGRGDTDWVGD